MVALMKSWRDCIRSPQRGLNTLLLFGAIAAAVSRSHFAAGSFISPIPDQTVPEKGQTKPISFTVSSANVSLQGASSDTALVPGTNIVFSGSGTDRSVRITAAPNRFGQTIITIRAVGNGPTAITSFLLTVDAALHVDKTNGRPILSWTATNAVPLQASNPNGPWTEVGLSNPYLPTNAQPQYFRLRAE